MTAIVTDSLRRKLAENFLAEVNNGNDTNEYYIGIGKSDTYNDLDTVVDPRRTRREEREVRNNLQSVKKVSAASFVVPRYNWTAGTIYTGWNDNSIDIPQNSYYILTEDNEVYICLQQGKNANGVANTSTVKPSFTDAGVTQLQAFETADGYRWKFMYALSATRAANFLSAGYMPIEKVQWEEYGDSDELNTFELQQLAIQRNAIPGQILGVTLTSGGSGYSSAPTVTFRGNGSGAAATAYIAAGSIVKIEMNNESDACGSNYDYADVVITGGGGTGAEARPIISPVLGITGDALEDLKANAIALNIKPDGAEDGTFITDNDFRQISVMRNLKIFDSDAIFTETSGRAMRYLKMTEPATTFSEAKTEGTGGVALRNTLIRGAASGAAAYIDDIDSDFIWYHQNENTGFIPFQDGEGLAESDGEGSGTIQTANLHGPVDAHSGQILYIENRTRIIRGPAQQEDIKTIIRV